MDQSGRIRRACFQGLTLVELLICMVLMGLLILAINLSLRKLNLQAASVFHRKQAAHEVHFLFHNLKDSISTASSIDGKSVSSRIVMCRIDESGVPFLEAYRFKSANNSIETSTNLQDASDAGATWTSPYATSGSTAYKVSGEFLYCGYGNNCTRFPDGNGNGVWDGSGTDGAPVVPAPFTGTPLTSPAQATKVVLFNFSFDRLKGSPSAVRTLPNIFVKLGPRLVDPGSPLSFGSPLINTLVPENNGTSPDNTAFTSGYTIRAITYDSTYRRLLALCSNGTQSRLYVMNQHGMLIRQVTGGSLSPNPITINGAASTNNTYGLAVVDKHNVLVLDSDSHKVYPVNITTGTVSSALSLPGAIGGDSTTGIVYDPSQPAYVYVLGTDALPPNNNKLFRLNKNDLSSAGGHLALPAALSGSSSYLFGLFMDPASGDFYILLNNAIGPAPDYKMEIFRIRRSSSTTDERFPISLGKLTGPLGNASTNPVTIRSLAYDFETNHLFLADSDGGVGAGGGGRIYEFVPTRIISAR